MFEPMPREPMFRKPPRSDAEPGRAAIDYWSLAVSVSLSVNLVALLLFHWPVQSCGPLGVVPLA